jgi:hypothetical protein
MKRWMKEYLDVVKGQMKYVFVGGVLDPLTWSGEGSEYGVRDRLVEEAKSLMAKAYKAGYQHGTIHGRLGVEHSPELDTWFCAESREQWMNSLD